jgi:hypothetical protein
MEFKVGDRVKLKANVPPAFGLGLVKVGEVGVLKFIHQESPYKWTSIFIDFPSHPSWCGLLNEIELAPTPHAHAEIIKQWADNPSLTIEVKDPSGKWQGVESPVWDTDYMYRIKEHVKFKEVKTYNAAYMTSECLKLSYGYYIDKEDFEKRNPSGDKEFIGLILSTEKIKRVEVE